MSANNSDYRARRGSAEDISNLVAMYAQMDSTARGETLVFAAEAIAVARVRGQKTTEGEAVDTHDWLTQLAEDTFPDVDDAAALMTFAREVEMSADEAFFPDGKLHVALCAADDEQACGEHLFNTYMSIRDTTDAMIEPPDPCAYLGIRVPKTDFEEWHDDGCVLDEEAWTAEGRRLCILSFAEMVAWWRGNFFEALLSGKQPTARRRELPVQSVTNSLADLTDEDIDQLVDDAMRDLPPGGAGDKSAFDDISGLAPLLAELAVTLKDEGDSVANATPDSQIPQRGD